jgi:hypothetical protein
VDFCVPTEEIQQALLEKGWSISSFQEGDYEDYEEAYWWITVKKTARHVSGSRMQAMTGLTGEIDRNILVVPLDESKLICRNVVVAGEPRVVLYSQPKNAGKISLNDYLPVAADGIPLPSLILRPNESLTDKQLVDFLGSLPDQSAIKLVSGRKTAARLIRIANGNRIQAERNFAVDTYSSKAKLIAGLASQIHAENYSSIPYRVKIKITTKEAKELLDFYETCREFDGFRYSHDLPKDDDGRMLTGYDRAVSQMKDEIERAAASEGRSTLISVNWHRMNDLKAYLCEKKTNYWGLLDWLRG